MRSIGTARDGSTAKSEIAELRLRAFKCREYAREYHADVGSSLSELAVELEKEADRMERARALRR